MKKNKQRSGSLSIVVTGDFCPVGEIEKHCLRGNFTDLFNDALPILQDKDISITNLECPLTHTSRQIQKSGPQLHANPGCIEALRFAQFDITSLANNHIGDQGAKGVLDTLKVCAGAAIATVGAGENLEAASHPLFLERNGVTIGIIAAAENEFGAAKNHHAGFNPLDLASNYEQLQQARARADLVLVLIHGGHERYVYPSPEVQKRYRFFASIGADAVIGHHAHYASGYEIFRGVPIFYSLGNFLFPALSTESNNWHKALFLVLQWQRQTGITFSLVPFTQGKDTPGVRLMNSEEGAEYIQEIEAFSRIIQDPAKLKQEWTSLVASRERYYLSELFGFSGLTRFLARNSKLRRYLVRSKLRPGFLNVIRCESHREAILDIMENSLSER